ncbi:hypothetical protein SCY_2521 [Saccharomyces cerevisiae YJM789]|uniref:Uncharacterized protein n=1 Tax=Saccharomyces cerevisiae (strain YJM789) TaxID=307796 RepID=A6ZT37_YEAS7|nr:hypothetical protein SCY_2521 [Saccharomyces cerevisiae YJM789]
MLHDEEFFYFFFISFYTLWIVFFLLHLSFFSILSFGIFHDFDTDVYIKVGNYILHFLELSKNSNLLKNSSEMLKHFRLASLMYILYFDLTKSMPLISNKQHNTVFIDQRLIRS